MNRQYAFSRNFEGESVVVTVNNDDSDFTMTLPAGNAAEYVGALSGQKVRVENGNICVNVKANSGEIWLPVTDQTADKLSNVTPVTLHVEDAAKTTVADTPAPQNSPSAPQTAKSEPAPAAEHSSSAEPAAKTPADTASAPTAAPAHEAVSEDFERGKIAGLQEAILAIMEKNGPVTDQMRRDVTNNVYHDSLVNWIKSFR